MYVFCNSYPQPIHNKVNLDFNYFCNKVRVVFNKICNKLKVFSGGQSARFIKEVVIVGQAPETDAPDMEMDMHLLSISEDTNAMAGFWTN